MTAVCNIGPKNSATRKKIGIILIIAAGILSGFLIAAEASMFTRLIVFPFFLGGFISLLEAEKKVCVWYAYQKITKME